MNPLARTDRLPLPPQQEKLADYDWLKKTQQAVDDLQQWAAQDEPVPIEQFAGDWIVHNVTLDAIRVEMDQNISRIVAKAPVPVGWYLTRLDVYGYNPSSLVRELDCEVCEQSDEQGSTIARVALKRSSTIINDFWVVSFAGADSGLPRQMRQGKPLYLDIRADGSVGTECYVTLVRWTFKRTNA